MNEMLDRAIIILAYLMVIFSIVGLLGIAIEKCTDDVYQKSISRESRWNPETGARGIMSGKTE
jgi:hypothetical protein